MKKIALFLQCILISGILQLAIAQRKYVPIGGTANSPISQVQKLDLLAATSQIKRGNITYYLSKEGSAKNNSYVEKKIESSTQSDPSGTNRICKSERSNFTAENMTQDILNPEAISDLRLGAVYKYVDLGNGNFNAIYGNRNPMYFSITNGTQMVTVQQPSSITLLNGLNQIKDITFKDCPVGLGQYLETKTVNSVEALNIALGASYSGFGFNAAATFQSKSDSKKSKFILTYLNPVYSITAIPNETGKLFNTDADNNNGEYIYI